jgi:glc operon protein GlcG
MVRFWKKLTSTREINMSTGTVGLFAFIAFATSVVAVEGAQAPATFSQIPGPTLMEARKALDAAEASATKAGLSLSCVVVDSRGDLIALHRMDNARFLTMDVARGKALAAAAFGQPSGSLSQIATGPWFQNLNAAAQGRLYPVQGGVPIIRNKQTYGAVACSGGTGQQDEDSAKAGAAVFDVN